MNGVGFDKATHAYTDLATGRKVPLSVTGIIKRAGMADTRFWNDEARERGSRVHEAIGLDHDGVLDEASCPDVLPYVHQWRRFVREAGFTVCGFEEPIADLVRGYAGTYDAWGFFDARPTERALIDIKTGSCPPWVGLQLAAYDNAMGGGHRRYSLVVTPDRYLLAEHTDRRDWSLFQAALAVATWQVQHGL